MFKLGRPPFKETRWVVTSFKVTCYVQFGSSAFQSDTLGCHLVRSDMLYSSWVVISLQVTCYIQIGSSAFQEKHLGCHLHSSDTLSSGWFVCLSKDKLSCHLAQSDILFTSSSFQRGTLPSLCNF